MLFMRDPDRIDHVQPLIGRCGTARLLRVATFNNVYDW
jgi:hypothetical protein